MSSRIFAITLAAFATFANVHAAHAGLVEIQHAFTCGNIVHQPSSCKTSTNIYPCCTEGNLPGGNCTWYAWEMACRNWGIALGAWNDAKYWAGFAKGDPRLHVAPDTSPSVGSIGCNTTIGSGNVITGHVAWVVGVNGNGTVATHQEGCGTSARDLDGVWEHPADSETLFNGGYISLASAGCACTPGATESQTCACGSRTRTCDTNCQWDGWGVCKGTPEICDGIDNDCNGLIDDGNPPLGSTPMQYAATLIDQSSPQSLAQGETATIWAEFRNDGTATWPVGGVWLGAEGSSDGQASTLSVPNWPAWNVAATIDHATAPGATARFTFEIVASQAGQITETFRLELPSGTAINCPDTSITPSIFVVGNKDGGVDGGSSNDAATGCALAPATTTRTSAPWFLLLGLLLVRKRTRT